MNNDVKMIKEIINELYVISKELGELESDDNEYTDYSGVIDELL